MRSEKLNAQKNIISRLEVPVGAVCALPNSQRIRGWVVDCDGLCENLTVRLNESEIPFTVIPRPDVKKGYQNVPDSRILGFEAEAQVPEGNSQAVISVSARLQGGEEVTLLENIFAVRAVDPDVPALFDGCETTLMKPECFSMPVNTDFTGTFVLSPPGLPEAAVLPSTTTIVLWKFRKLLLDTINTHELYFAIYDYAASRMDNLAISRLNLDALLKSYMDAIGVWLKDACGSDGRCLIDQWLATVMPFFLSRVFPNARFEVKQDAGIIDPTWEDEWQSTLRLLGDRVRHVDELNHPDEPKREAFAPQSLTVSWPVYEQEKPIFVLGAGRSGTSVTMRILAEGKYPSFMEGHIFPYMERQLKVIAEAWEEITRYLPDSPIVPERTIFERPLVEMTAAGAKKDPQSLRWVDKTPDSRMIEVVPHLARLYPNAQYIYLRRHPLKLAESRSRKFNEPVGTALGEWLKCETLWANAKPTIPKASWVEFDQSDFSLRTGKTMKAMIEFLAPEESQARRMYYAARVIRPQNTLQIGKGETEMGNDRRDYLYRQLLDLVPASLADLKWPDAAVVYYHSQCREIAESLGYHAEPSLKEITTAIRDVSAEIYDYEEFLVNEARREENRNYSGIKKSATHLARTLKTSIQKTLNSKQ
jgi:hypothetical protein